MAAVDIPKKGLAGVVVNEGPEFRIEVQEVDVPEPSELLQTDCKNQIADMSDCQRPENSLYDSMPLDFACR